MPKGCLILSFMKIGDKKNFDLEFFKKLRLGKSKKHLGKIFLVSDFDENHNLKFLWPMDFSHEI